ncbi:MAG: DinB family protein [Candidatus Eisenbacteria bacterium]
MLGAYTGAFQKLLDDLRREVEAYSDESRLWIVGEGIANSGGNLALHVLGNLQHFIGAELGRTGYVRDRDAEFANKDVPRGEILAKIAEVHAMIEAVLGGVPERDLEMEVAAPALGGPQRLDRWLLHLVSHLAYHLGQINYHRRLLDQ